jgi:hypothetical protein
MAPFGDPTVHPLSHQRRGVVLSRDADYSVTDGCRHLMQVGEVAPNPTVHRMDGDAVQLFDACPAMQTSRPTVLFAVSPSICSNEDSPDNVVDSVLGFLGPIRA